MRLSEFTVESIVARIKQKLGTDPFDDDYFEVSKSTAYKLNLIKSEVYQGERGEIISQEAFIVNLYNRLVKIDNINEFTAYNLINNLLYYLDLSKFQLPRNFKDIKLRYYDSLKKDYCIKDIPIQRGIGVSLYVQYVIANHNHGNILIKNKIAKTIYAICTEERVLDSVLDKHTVYVIKAYLKSARELIDADQSGDGHPTIRLLESFDSLADNSFSAYFYNRKNGLIDIGSASSELRSRIKKFSGFVYASMKNCHHWWAIDNNGSNLEKLGFSEDDLEDIKEDLGIDDLLELADDRDFMAETGEDFEYLMNRIYKRGNLQIRIYSDLITIIVKNLSKYGKSLVVDFLASNSWIYDDTPDKQISVYQADDDSVYNIENGKYRELLKKLLESKDKKLSPLTEFFEFVKI